MKAYTRSAEKEPRIFHGRELRLTIGLIVRNAEKRLDRCLSSLERLRKEVPSELIVTDTGSTDRTVEIARKYTDRVLSFEWCDDFSAARNTGLLAAKGEWFLFLDDDEWFEDTSELIRFFNSGECDRYNTGSYIVRNYADFSGKKYTDFYAGRLLRVSPGLCFHNKIHEDFPLSLPTKIFDAFVHHYGYVFHSVEEKDTKARRNLRLLVKELEENPDDLKACAQISGQYLDMGENEKAFEYAERGLHAALSQPRNMRIMELTLNKFRACCHMERFGDILEMMDRYLMEEPERNVFHLEMLRMAQAAALRLQQYRRSLEYGRLYLMLYRDFEEGRLDKTLLMYSIFPNITAGERRNARLDMTRAHLALREDGAARETFAGLDPSGPYDPADGSLDVCFELFRRTGDEGLLAGFCGECVRSGGSGAEEAVAVSAERCRELYPQEEETLRRALARLEPKIGPYAKVCALREAEKNGDHALIRKILEEFEHSKGKLRPFESDALYYSMKEGRNIMPLLMKADVELFSVLTARMRHWHGDFAAVVEEYMSLYSFQNSLGLRWMAALEERVIFEYAQANESEKCLSVFENWLRLAMKVCRATYLPEMLSQPLIVSLPAKTRFVCAASAAFSAKNRGDGVAYLSGLRAALKEYPCMEEPVRFLLARFEKEQKEQDRKAEEFASLARQVKQNIEALIAKGDLARAGQVTAQLAALMPNDEDVRRYEKLTHTEPTMREIASRLPQ